MKTLIGMFSFLMLIGCASTPKIASAVPAMDLSGRSEVVLTVHGLSCPLCSNNLDGQLQKIEGVQSATIDLKTGAVTVALKNDHSVTTQDFTDAVKNAGFTLKAIEPVGGE
jgi:copper chaperone CopZ